MYCYQHRDQHAVGLCKHCSKAVCDTCAQDTQNGLACSDYCAAEVTALFQITERAKRIYRIGKKTRAPSKGTNLCYLVGIALIANGIYPEFNGGHANLLETLIGFGAIALGIYLHIIMSPPGKDDA